MKRVPFKDVQIGQRIRFPGMRQIIYTRVEDEGITDVNSSLTEMDTEPIPRTLRGEEPAAVGKTTWNAFCPKDSEIMVEIVG